jgi:hypothetical protein
LDDADYEPKSPAIYFMIELGANANNFAPDLGLLIA